jgi:hypothetical protein
MIIQTALFFQLFLTTDMTTLSNQLANENYKVRKVARVEAENLPVKELRKLISLLQKSTDPELSETAKELTAMLPENLNPKIISILVHKNKLTELKAHIKRNKDILRMKINKLTLLDHALICDSKATISYLEGQGVPQTISMPDGNLKTMDVLIVESDTWESLASDFNTQKVLIKIINKNVKLLPGTVIKVPHGN